MHPYAGWAYGCGWGWVFPLAFLVLVAVFMFRVVPSYSRHGDSREKEGETALKILDRRYASGEINREEYQAMKKDLGG